MTTDTPTNLSSDAGSAGAQSSFLEECGAFAILAQSGVLSRTNHHPLGDAVCHPVRSRLPQERANHCGHDCYMSRSNMAIDLGRKNYSELLSMDCAASAHSVIAALSDDAIRSMFTDYFEETAAFIEFEQDKPREFAEQQALALLLGYMHRFGIQIRAGS